MMALKWRKGVTEKYGSFLSNVFSLSLLQGANYLLPLLTIPYLVRVLGVEYYGAVAFAAAMMTYFTLLTDYGFNLSATRQISINRDSADQVSKIYSAVMMVRAILLVVSILLCSVAVMLFDKLRSDYLLYIFSFFIVFGQFLFPVWLFQGLEIMKYIAILNIISKAIFTVMIFLFVNHQDDYLLVPMLTSVGAIVAGLLAQFFIITRLKIQFRLPTFADIRHQFLDGWHIFFSSASISIYTVSTTFILGVFSSNQAVGYFAAADKIVQAIKGLYQPISQAMYPLVSKRISEHKASGVQFLRRIAIALSAFMLIICSLVYCYSDVIVDIVLGDEYAESEVLLRVMAFLPFIIVLSNMFGVQGMVNLNMKVQFSRILMMAAMAGVVLSLLSVPVYGAMASALISLIIEIFVTLTMAIYLWRKL